METTQAIARQTSSTAIRSTNKCLQRWSEMGTQEIISLPVVLSEEHMVDTECPTLCEVDKKVARESLMAIIGYFSKSLNQQRAMSPEQIKVMAYDMVDEFPNDSFLFVKLFFKKMRTGAFGNIYGTVDELTILNLYRKYRNEVVTKYPMRKPLPKPKADKALKEPDDGVLMPDWFKEKFGIKDGQLSSVIGSQPQQEKEEVNPLHGLYQERLKNAKTQSERIAIMQEYLKL